MLKQSNATLSEVYHLNSLLGNTRKKPQKTNSKTFLFDDICTVLTTSYVFPVFGGIVQEYFPTVSWERTIHLP